MDGSGWNILMFIAPATLVLCGLIVGCVLGTRWIKVAFYWTQNKIRHLRNHH